MNSENEEGLSGSARITVTEAESRRERIVNREGSTSLSSCEEPLRRSANCATRSKGRPASLEGGIDRGTQEAETTSDGSIPHEWVKE